MVGTLENLVCSNYCWGLFAAQNNDEGPLARSFSHWLADFRVWTLERRSFAERATGTISNNTRCTIVDR